MTHYLIYSKATECDFEPPFIIRTQSQTFVWSYSFIKNI